jgi:transcriptional regulator with XRE-family HTH domain
MASTSRSQDQARPDIRKLLATNVVARRRALGWSQEALSFECGLHRTFVAHVEREARNISLDNIDRIAAALGVATYELLLPVDP